MFSRPYEKTSDTTNVSRKPRRSRRWLVALVLVALGIAGLLYLGTIAYFFVLRYDVPFRYAGHYEKNITGMERPFSLSPDGATLVYGSLVTGKGDLYEMDMQGRNVRRLTSDSEYEGGPCYSPDGHWIAFCRETDKCGHIWRIAPDGTGLRQITFGTDYDTNPIFTCDGSHILFDRTPSGTSAGISSRFMMTADGKKITPLELTDPQSAEGATCSPPGDTIYYTRADHLGAGRDQIWRVKRNGASNQELAEGTHPAVSWSGKRIAFVSAWSKELWSLEADGSHQRLVYRSNTDKASLLFSRDDRFLLFFESNDHGEYISRVALDGSNYHQIQRLPRSW